MIRFHELKCPGKEIIKGTTWGTRHNNLPRLVALSITNTFDDQARHPERTQKSKDTSQKSYVK